MIFLHGGTLRADAAPDQLLAGVGDVRHVELCVDSKAEPPMDDRVRSPASAMPGMTEALSLSSCSTTGHLQLWCVLSTDALAECARIVSIAPI